MSPHEAAITLCAAAAAGVFFIALAEKLRVPSIALLLLGGIALGPEYLGIVDPATLGGGLETVVGLAVAVILFEGGLTLDIAGFRREPKVILRMLTLGVLVTWAGTAAAVYLVYENIGLELAIIAGSLVIVTGPTVVSPLLRRIGVKPRLHHILYWEGVIVDAVGVFCAVLSYEWIASSGDTTALMPLGRFALRIGVGVGIGLAVGLALGFVLQRRWVSHEHTNIVVLASALTAVGAANAVLPEAGILAVIVAGLVVSLHRAPLMEDLRRFELELTEVGIGLLFVLLAARLDLQQFVDDGGHIIAILVLVLFVLRPINVVIATAGQQFSWREKAFLSWLAPRGIVAASMASLFALRLQDLGYEQAGFLETMTYAVIGTTVIVQGLTAPAVARLLGVERKREGAWLLVGDPELGVALHRQLRQAGARSLVMAAGGRTEDLHGDELAVIGSGDPLNPAAINDPRLGDVEAVLVLARDPVLNQRLCAAWSQVVGDAACYRWSDPDSEGEHGIGLWNDVASPGEVAASIDAGRVTIEALDVGPPEDRARFGANLRPLLAVSDGQIQVVDREVPPAASHVVALRTRITGLYGLVRDAVILDSHRPSFEGVVSQLLERAATANPGLPEKVHLAEILDREATMTTAIGNGVAIPHVYDDHCKQSTCWVANIAGGLDVAGPDDEPVRLVFLVVSPAGHAQEHLRSLAAVAQLASDHDLLDVLARQRTRGRLLTLLRERE